MLISIDNLILGWHEKFAHWFQEAFGRDCFWLAKAAVVLGSFALITFYFFEHKDFWDFVAVALLLLLWVSVRFSQILKRERYIKECCLPQGLANPAKVLGEIRVLMTILFIVLLFPTGALGYLKMVKWFCWFYHLVATFYFEACDPLPPAKSKVRKWLEALSGKIKEALAPKPEPVPEPT